MLLKVSPEQFRTGFSLMVLAPLPDTKVARSHHLDPTKIPPQDRDIHLVGFKFCPDTNPLSTLEAATAQHANALTRLKTRSSRNPNRNNKVTLHIILVGVAGTIYKDYTIQPLIDLGDFWGRVCWAHGGGEQEKKSPGDQEHGS
eukprot:1142670-Pelagomonas_calceolata.AAC.1